MADEDKTLPATTVPPVPAAPAATYPWQTAPPGPPGAAIDPPPCSPSGVPFQATAFGAGAEEIEYTPKQRLGGDWDILFRACTPLMVPAVISPRQQQVAEPAVLGKPRSSESLDTLIKGSGWTPHGKPPDAPHK